jgi:hypothetical protein
MRRRIIVHNHWALRRVRDQAYALPFTEIAGLQIVVETRAGTIRRGKGWEVVFPCDYGYIRRVGSAEGEEEWLDCFIGNHHSSRDVWIIDAMRPSGKFDEHKLMIGFLSKGEAVDCFKKSYTDKVRRVGAVTHMSLDSLEFKNWIARGNKYVPVAPELRKAA